MVTHLGCVLGLKRVLALHLVKVLILKRDMSRQTTLASYSNENFSMRTIRDLTFIDRNVCECQNLLASFLFLFQAKDSDGEDESDEEEIREENPEEAEEVEEEEAPTKSAVRSRYGH